jgi:CubicO group peptidase (beta-lactamase class C family)
MGRSFSFLFLSAALLQLFLSIPLWAQKNTEPSVAADAFLKQEMKDLRIPGLQVAVVQKGKIVFLKSYGYGNLQDSTAVSNRSVFSINSCTKAFTGVAIMQLVEEGKVDLSAPVSRYLDELPAAWQAVTIRQLLTHVSGIPDILRIVGQGSGSFVSMTTEAAAMEKVKAAPMEFKTGTQFSYNQTNYLLLGKIIDKLRAKPFADVFRERQFNIAGMPNTGFGDSRDVIPHKAQSYRYVSRLDGIKLPKDTLTNVYEEFPAALRTGASINSTAEDLAKWIIALQTGKILHEKSTLKTLWSPGAFNNGSPTQWTMGWVSKSRPKHQAIISTGGGRSAFFVYPEDDLAIVLLTNLSGSYPEDLIDELAGYFNPEIPLYDPISALNIQFRKQGFEKASEIFREQQKNNPNFHPSETDLNDWAYRLMSRQQNKLAQAVFKMIVDAYPGSWNAYDSYGEILLKNGQKEEAIKAYKKSVEINPENKNGLQILQRLAN